MPLRINVEINPIHSSGQGDAPDEENNQNEEWEGSGEVHHLTHWLHPLGYTGEHHGPSKQVAPKQLPHDGAQLVYALGYYQDVIAAK